MVILIDCGTNEKQGLYQLVSMHPEIEVGYSFEANPIVYDSNDKTDGINYYNVAVSDKNGFSEFYLERDITKGDKFIGGGSRMQDPRIGVIPCFKDESHFEPISGGKITNNPEEFINDMYLKKIVPTIRLVDFINYLNPEDKSVILKLDVEGCEYPILEDMKKSNVFNKIKKVYIEFHEWARTPEYDSNTTWLKYFSENNIDYGWWG